MLKTVRGITELITAEVDSGIPASRILLGGMSQGGAMTLLTGLTIEYKLAGLLVFSGWLPLSSKFKSVGHLHILIQMVITELMFVGRVQMASDHATKVPIFWGHGTADPLVKHKWGVDSVNYLKNKIGVKEASSEKPQEGGIIFRGYDDLGHSVDVDELRDAREWMKAIIPDQE